MNAGTDRQRRSQLVRWTVAGAVAAGGLSVILLLPALWQQPRTAATAGLFAAAGGALAGGAAVGLYRLAGRARFFGLTFVLAIAGLAFAATRDASSAGLPLIWAALVVASALSLWGLLAYGLHRLRGKVRGTHARATPPSNPT